MSRIPAVPLAAGVAGIASGVLLLRAQHSRKRMERFAAATLETLLNAIDANDRDTGAHVRRVATYALILADEAGLDDRQRRSVERVALFHDIGKIHAALFDIIHEETSLTPAERRAIDTHPHRGATVLSPVAKFYPDLSEGVLSHHERWDGNGYPRKLRGPKILSAQGRRSICRPDARGPRSAVCNLAESSPGRRRQAVGRNSALK